jgi:nicotinate-nucleotide adenylyltransferase
MTPPRAAALIGRPARAPAIEPAAAQRGRGDPNIRLPPYTRGMRIGLFGGTFDPPHAAHRAATLIALRRLDLDRVWWLVTPGNPLKQTHGLAPLAERLAAAQALAHHPRIAVSGIEATIGTRYTHDTLRYLLARCAGVHFVWIMGADNLATFHRWEKWRAIAAMIPIAVIDRLGARPTSGCAAQWLGRYRVPASQARTLPYRRPPAWVYLHGLKSPLSSTALRAARNRVPTPDARRFPLAASAPTLDGHKCDAKIAQNKNHSAKG